MMIQYCGKCGSRIESVDLEAGRAVQHRDSVYCASCRIELGIPSGGDAGSGGRKSSADSTASRKATGRDGGSSRKPTDSTVRRLARLGEVEAPRAEGTARRDRRSDAAVASRSAGRAASPIAIAAGVGIAALAILGVLLSTRSGGPAPAPVDQVRTAPPPPEPPKPRPPDLLAGELAAFRSEAVREPRRFAHFLARAAELRGRMANTPHAEALSAIQRDLELRRDRAAADLYERTSTAAKELEAAGSFELAIERWRAFDEELITDTWRSRIGERIGEIQRVQREHEQATPPTVPDPDPIVATPAKVFKVGTIPPGGRTVVCLGATSSSNWRVRSSGRLEGLRIGPEGLAADHKGTEQAVLYVFDQRKFTWRDTYAVCEYQLVAGEFTLLQRLPATSDQEKKTFITLNTTVAPEEGARGLWHRLHVVVRGQTCEYWLENEADVQTIECDSEHGVIGLLIKPGDRCRVRRLEVRAYSDGVVGPPGLTGAEGSD